MNRRAKRVVVLIVGWGFIVLGVAGLFLPILQGILFLLIGLFILSSEYVWAHHLLRRLKEKFPQAGKHMDRAAAKAKDWQDRHFRDKNSPPSAPSSTNVGTGSQKD